jgi:biopolymer transport protein ExbB/biopolymer transport protein TolQ
MESIDVSHFTLTGMWGQMGLTAKVVVAILVLMSIWSLGFAIERAVRFHRARKQSLKVAAGITPLLEAHKLDEAISYATRKEFAHSHIASVVAAGLKEFQFERSLGELPADFDIVDSANRAIERETLMRTADFRKGLGNLATISTTAPFVGLFGTVIGIINSFRGMALSGSGGIGAVSAGIAEALFATAIGLGVAIPAVWLYNHFTNRIERFNVEMKNASSELVDYFLKNRRA